MGVGCVEGNNLNNSFKVNNWVKNFIALFWKHLSLKCDSLLQLHPFRPAVHGTVGWREGSSGALSASLELSKRGIAQHFGAAVVWSGSETPHKGTCLFLCSYREGPGRISLCETLQASFGKTAHRNSKKKNSRKTMPRHFHQIYIFDIFNNISSSREGPTGCPKHILSSSRREHFQEKGFVQQSVFSLLHQQPSHKGHSSSTNLLSSGQR